MYQNSSEMLRVNKSFKREDEIMSLTRPKKGKKKVNVIKKIACAGEKCCIQLFQIDLR